MTIRDIARLSGCGVATVSRVLNGHRDVSEETRRRVLAVVEEQGFQPNANARHLKRRGGAGVAVLVKGRNNLLFAQLVEGVQARLEAEGQETALCYLDEEEDEVARARQLCREGKPQGLLFLGGDTDCFRRGFGEISLPAVLLTAGAEELGFENLSSLTIDDRAAAARVVDYLAGAGHRRMGVLGGSGVHAQVSRRRLEGCRQALDRLGLPFCPEEQYEPCRYSLADACAAAGRLLDRAPDLTAIFALSDVMALGCLRALADRGLKAPRDLSVVGFDGVELARYCVPRLTTVRQDTDALAEQGVELLLGRIRGELARPVHRTVPFLLEEGESVARPADKTGEEVGIL